jgi:hypothetical protein
VSNSHARPKRFGSDSHVRPVLLGSGTQGI